MKILDLQTGDVHEYGTDRHDSLFISQDGRTLCYHNLQNGDGSSVGDYRFVMDDNKVPEESQTADALHAQCIFNIGGWGERNTGAWLIHEERKTFDGGGSVLLRGYKCPFCGNFVNRKSGLHKFCHECGADLRETSEEVKQT